MKKFEYSSEIKNVIKLFSDTEMHMNLFGKKEDIE